MTVLWNKAGSIRTALTGTFMMLLSVAACATPLQVFHDVKLIDNASNDGDSFLVDVEGTRYRIRLYFVDTPETEIVTRADENRLREQRRYFGLASNEQVRAYGEKAKTFSREILSRPFTIYTAFASARGRANNRIYAFVETAEGKDLASLLVKKGLARTYGVGRTTPDGTARDEFKENLRDLEVSAMLAHRGAWSKADPEKIAELRAEQRLENRVNAQRSAETARNVSYHFPLDINTCDIPALETLPGMGWVTARKIVSGRPYKSLDDLLEIEGIGSGKLEAWSPFLDVP